MKAFTCQLEEGLPLIHDLKQNPLTFKDAITLGAPPESIEELFIKKVQACAVVFDFSNDNDRYLEEKDVKRKTLLELIQFLEQPPQQKAMVLNEKVVAEVVKTVAINIFRTPK